MAEELHSNQHHENAGFEREDMGARNVYAFLIALALIGVLVHFVVKGMYGFMDSYDKAHQPPASPLATTAETAKIPQASISEKFPLPRLETNERLEIKDFRTQEEQTLNSYGWVDQQNGVVRIPIERAMQLLAERGLPTRPQVGTVPPSPVNVAKEAAERSDTSRKQRKKE
jgi:hypothetical protein